MTAMNFDQARRAERWHALTLGIPGMSSEADASRLHTARRVETEYDAYVERVYARATGTIDPDPQPSFCLHLLIRADGNIQRVVDDPRFAHEVLNHMGLGHREEFYRDEDGDRWESISPGVDDYQAAARETAHIRTQLQARSLLPRSARGQAVHNGVATQHGEPPQQPDATAPTL